MPTVLVTGADEADWRDERAYDYTAALTPREWAWEFLRRNPAFQRDLVAARQQAESWSHQPLLDVVASAGDLSRWGVLFSQSLMRTIRSYSGHRSGSSMCCRSLRNSCLQRRRLRRSSSRHCHVVRRSCWRATRASMFFFAMRSTCSSSPSLAPISCTLFASAPRRSGPRRFRSIA